MSLLRALLRVLKPVSFKPEMNCVRRPPAAPSSTLATPPAATAPLDQAAAGRFAASPHAASAVALSQSASLGAATVARRRLLASPNVSAPAWAGFSEAGPQGPKIIGRREVERSTPPASRQRRGDVLMAVCAVELASMLEAVLVRT
jgi:hypothetical protein